MASMFDTLAVEVQAASILQLDIHRVTQGWDPVSIEGWRNLSSNQVEHVLGGTREQTVAAGILSMHPRGYVREVALEHLRSAGGNALLFATARCVDWVPEVQWALYLRFVSTGSRPVLQARLRVRLGPK